jgi:hypothetical protein
MERIDLWTFREPGFADTDVVGYAVEATDGSLGKIDDASYEAGAGYVVVDTSSFKNLGFGKQSLIPAAAIDRVDHGGHRVFLGLTQDQIKDAPEFRSFDDTYREHVSGYYGPFIMAPDSVAPGMQRAERR